MQIASKGDDLHEMSGDSLHEMLDPVFWEK